MSRVVTRARAVVVPALLSIALLLAGCVPLPVGATSASGGQRSETPVSDNRAPEAAVAEPSPSPGITLAMPGETIDAELGAEIVADRFLAYQDAVAAVLREGGDPEGRLDAMTTDNFQSGNRAVVDLAASDSFSVSGENLVTKSALTGYDRIDGVEWLTGALCVDASTFTVKNSAGETLGTKNHSEALFYEVHVVIEDGVPLLHEQRNVPEQDQYC